MPRVSNHTGRFPSAGALLAAPLVAVLLLAIDGVISPRVADAATIIVIDEAAIESSTEPVLNSDRDRPRRRTTEGIDVSHWQGRIDWERVREAGKRFVFIKASEDDDFVDWAYGRNRREARDAGLLVGAYHFARPRNSRADAQREADHFVDTARFREGDLLPVLDLEVYNGLRPSSLRAWTRNFVERVYERTGVKPILYVSPYFWRVRMDNTTWFADHGYKVLWIAHWTDEPSPKTPADDWGGEGWTFWQYTSSGSVPGIRGRVDLNRYNGRDFSDVRIP